MSGFAKGILAATCVAALSWALAAIAIMRAFGL